ncbi:MAG: YegP family protein [Bacteroidota bacterium]
MGTFIVFKRKNGDFQFDLKAGNGQIILTSEGYTTKSACENGIESVKRNSQDDNRFDRKVSANGKPYFNLTATNGQIIGTSELYESEASREKGIESVKKNVEITVLEYDLD